MANESELRLHRCCFTGHRPEKLDESPEEVKSWLETQIDKAISDGYTTFISGCAMGVDIWAGQISPRLPHFSVVEADHKGAVLQQGQLGVPGAHAAGENKRLSAEPREQIHPAPSASAPHTAASTTAVSKVVHFFITDLLLSVQLPLSMDSYESEGRQSVAGSDLTIRNPGSREAGPLPQSGLRAEKPKPFFRA